MTGTEGQRKLLLHPSRKKTNPHTNTELIKRSGTHTLFMISSSHWTYKTNWISST